MERCAPPKSSSKNHEGPGIRGSVARGRIELPTYRFSGASALALFGPLKTKAIQAWPSTIIVISGSSSIGIKYGSGYVTRRGSHVDTRSPYMNG